MNIKGFRLQSSIDLITEVLEHDELTGRYRIKRPLVPVQTDEKGSLAFAKWIQFSEDDEFVLNQRDIVGEPYAVWKQLEDSYIELTSGIALPKPGQSKLITG